MLIFGYRLQLWQCIEAGCNGAGHFIHGKMDDDPLSLDYVSTVFAHTKSPMKSHAWETRIGLKEHQWRKKERKELQQTGSCCLVVATISSR